MVKINFLSRFGKRLLVPVSGGEHRWQQMCQYSLKHNGHPPLCTPLNGLPTPVYITPEQVDHSLKISTLQNGLRVATVPHFGNYATIGVIIDAGAKNAGNYVGGITHVLEKLAFNKTVGFESRDSILLDLEKYGGICDCQADRDVIIYAISAENSAVDTIINILSEAVLQPKITELELNRAFTAVSFDIDTLLMKPEQDQHMSELIHAAAFRNKGYGLPAILPLEDMKKITKELIYTYLSNFYLPSRMVLCGVGIDHDQAVQAAEKHFLSVEPVWKTEKGVVLEGPKYLPEPINSVYVGGTALESCDIPTYANVGLPQLAHLVIALKSFPYADPDFITLCVLNLMMGGGNSFSAGGPGKGMYSRLFTNVLNRHHWMFACSAFNHTYASSGLFGIHASAPPEYLSRVASIVVRELALMASDDAASSLQRAKTQLKSLYLMNLESRPMVFEDVARQVLGLGCWKDRKYFIEKMNTVTADDVKRVARRLLASQPSVAARGDISELPSYSEICNKFLDNLRR